MNDIKLLENVEHYTNTKPFSIHKTEVEEGVRNALYVHYHPEMELIYLEKGEMTFFVEGHRYEMEAGDAAFVPPALVHNAIKEPDSSCTHFAVVFSEEWLFAQNTYERAIYNDIIYPYRYECVCVLKKSNQNNLEILSLLKQIPSFIKKNTKDYELALKGILLICFQRLYRECFSVLPASNIKISSQIEIQQTISYINNHFADDINIEKLSSMAGYSVSHYEHCFKALIGKTPFEYINHIRIINSAKLLKNTNMKIIDIAAECGFDNISYFNRVFKKIMGIAPKGYRGTGL